MNYGQQKHFPLYHLGCLRLGSVGMKGIRSSEAHFISFNVGVSE